MSGKSLVLFTASLVTVGLLAFACEDDPPYRDAGSDRAPDTGNGNAGNRDAGSRDAEAPEDRQMAGGGAAGHGPFFTSVGFRGELNVAKLHLAQIGAGRLYMVSYAGNLHVFDVATPGVLSEVARWRFPAFASNDDPEYARAKLWMGVSGRAVCVVSQGNASSYEGPPPAWSELVVRDANDPAVGSVIPFEGAIVDARIVKGVLVIVLNERCDECILGGPRTSIISYDVSVPGSVRKVDVLQYEGAHSVTLGAERLYVTNRREDTLEPFLQVIEIAAPSAVMSEAYVIDEMLGIMGEDERDGVLRLVDGASVHTFTVEPGAAIQLGQVELDASGTPKSVTFSAVRAYFINHNADRVLTVDLSDPENPSNGAWIEIQGTVGALVPRGERLLEVELGDGDSDGYDDVTARVFDVSDVARPGEVSAVRLTEPPETFVEDPGASVFDALGLALVQYNMTSMGASPAAAARLVDWDPGSDALAPCGRIPLDWEGTALVHDGYVITVDNEAVRSYDIANRDEPRVVSEFRLSDAGG